MCLWCNIGSQYCHGHKQSKYFVVLSGEKKNSWGVRMALRIVIPGTLPNLNDYIEAERISKYKAAALKRETENAIGYYINLAKRQQEMPGPPVTMHYTWIEPNRRRDLDNISSFGRKVIQDSLVTAGILPNDGWKHIAGFSDSFEVDAKNPRVEIEIRSLVGAGG